ncbi:MAG: hypothetical protein L0Z73_14100 [Gammaproteobacteria bacterium]|nr:hypothetical protein [Gammaproteobacteria bacterium]
MRGQFTQLGRKADADALAMHPLARSQGVAMLANAFHDERFIKQEAKQMCDWLKACVESSARERISGGQGADEYFNYSKIP